MNTDQIKILVKEIQNLFFRRDYKTIISSSKDAIKKYPNIAIFYNLLGLALSNIGNLKDARFVLEKGYKIKSQKGVEVMFSKIKFMLESDSSFTAFAIISA